MTLIPSSWSDFIYFLQNSQTNNGNSEYFFVTLCHIAVDPGVFIPQA
jgi:hypothetical protein